MQRHKHKKGGTNMDMRQCAQGGHYYDASIHADCPYCAAPNIGAAMPFDTGRTMPMGPEASSDIGKTMPLTGMTPLPSIPDDAGKTVALIKEELGIDPVVGWLVNLEGKEKGRDYRIHTDNNYIGRSEKMDICIGGDETISRENHATISYDARDKSFYFSPGDGRSIVRLNDKALFATAELFAHDILEIGKTKLVFVPLCGEKFEWA
jgi:hypothetical protein